MKHFPTLAFATLLAALAGCEGIGSGNTVQRLELVHRSGAVPAPPFKLYECVRDQVSAVAVFDDRTRADFSFRAQWISSDESKVRVSNNDIPVQIISEDRFKDSTLKYRPGTLIPVAPTGGTPVTITAKFAGLKATLQVEVLQPAFSITAAPVAPVVAGMPDTFLMGEGTVRSLRLLADLDGQKVQSASLNAFEVINPVLWRFVGGTYVARDADFGSDFNKFLSGGTTADPDLVINTTTGLVSGLQPGTGTAQAVLSLCPDAAAVQPGTTFPATPDAYRPTAGVEVVSFATSPLTVDYEDDFDADFVIGAFEQLRMLGELATGDFQDMSTLARAVITPFNGCEEFPASACTANDSLGLSLGSRNQIQAAANAVTVGGTDDNVDPIPDDPYDANALACFPDVTPLATLEVAADAQSTPAQPGPAQVLIAAGETAKFTAAAVYPPTLSGAPSIVSYVFNYGDGTVEKLTTPTASHIYATGGRAYRATVTLVDECGRISSNAGGALVGVDLPPDADGILNPPVAGALDFRSLLPLAPTNVILSATGFSDPDKDFFVYEFDFGDGSPVVRTIAGSLTRAFSEAPASEPSVRAVDTRGGPSAWVLTSTDDAEPLDSTVITNSVALQHFKSGLLPLRAVKARLTALEVCTDANPITAVPCTPAAKEDVFTFPGQQFEAVGIFEADTSITGNTFLMGATTKRYKVTRLVSWRAFEQGTEELSPYVTIQNSNDGLLRDGQARYLQEPPGAGVVVDVIAALGQTLRSLLPEGTEPADLPTTDGELTVCPLGSGGTCTP
jgi:hypothetical protein